MPQTILNLIFNPKKMEAFFVARLIQQARPKSKITTLSRTLIQN